MKDYCYYLKTLTALLLLSSLSPSPVAVKAQGIDLAVLDTGARVTEIDLNPNLLIVADPSDSLEIDSFLDVPLSASFSPNTELKPETPLSGENTYWGMVELDNHIPYPTNWVISTGGLDLVELYLLSPDGEVSYQKTGRMVPASERAMMLGNNLDNRFKFELPEEGKYRLFIRMKNKFGMPVTFDVQLSRADAWEKQTLKSEVNRQLLFGFTAGLFIIMLLYNFLLFVVSKDQVYFYYSLYILFPLLYITNANGIFLYTPLGDFPLAFLYTRSITPAATLIVYLIFMRRFLNTKQLLGDKADRIISILVGLEVVNIVFILIGVTIGMTENIYRISAGLVHVVVFVGILYFLVRLLQTGDRLAKYFTLGASIFILSACFLAFVVLTGALPTQVGILVQTLGIAGELITFSLGLGYRIRMIERERAKVQEENARILATQKEELERRVTERTAEIEKQKEEIMTQNEELYQQQEEIITQRDYIERQKQSLQEQNNRMTDSIRYAQTIQQAILPLQGQIDQVFAENFLLYRPKDIVSGDFYWLMEAGNKLYLAVIDCTGHGVPGAFMSLVGATVLDDIINKEHIYDPAEILEHLNTSVQFLLKQDEKNQNQDGMDVCLCRFEPLDLDRENAQDFRVTFAGAKRPLFYTSKKAEGLQELKGARKAIGGMQIKGKEFTEETIVLSKGDILYLTTDGYIDQHGMQGRKIGTAKFIGKMSEVLHLPLQAQGEALEQLLDEHQGEQVQRDDITMMGVRL